jgi:hypothetical protein
MIGVESVVNKARTNAIRKMIERGVAGRNILAVVVEGLGLMRSQMEWD